MARKNSTKTASKMATVSTLHAATFNIAGVIKDVYFGEKYDYVTVNVDSENVNPKTNKPYYDTYSVVCPKEMEIPDDGEAARFIGRVKSFFNKDKQRTEYSFCAAEIYDINDDVPF